MAELFVPSQCQCPEALQMDQLYADAIDNVAYAATETELHSAAEKLKSAQRHIENLTSHCIGQVAVTCIQNEREYAIKVCGSPTVLSQPDVEHITTAVVSVRPKYDVLV